MTSSKYAFLLLFACVGLPAVSFGQFNGGGAAAFEPEIDVINSGILLDAQATVSADRKYVTMTMRPQNAELLALRTFAFQTGNSVNAGIQGMVGGVNPVVGGTPAPRQLNAPVRVSPGNGGAVIIQRGITPLKLK